MKPANRSLSPRGGYNPKSAAGSEFTPRRPSTNLNASKQGAQWIGRSPAPFGNPQPASHPLKSGVGRVTDNLSSSPSPSIRGSAARRTQPQLPIPSQTDMNNWSGHKGMSPLGKVGPLNSGYPLNAPRRVGDNRNQPRATSGMPTLSAKQRKAYPSLTGGYYKGL
jgi:hypothetical protein